MRARYTFIVFAQLSMAAFAQGPPNIEWQKCLGGSGAEGGRAVLPTPDGGCVFTSPTNSTNGQVTGQHGADDVWVVKMDPQGDLDWQRALGGSSFDYPVDILIANDGGYLICGSTFSSDGDVSANQGIRDAWLIKLANNGDLLWQRTYGGSNSDLFTGMVQLANGHLVLVGETRSDDGDVSSNHGESDMWVVELDPDGSIQWETSLGGTGLDAGHFIAVTSDNGYILQGTTSSNDGDVSGNHGATDLWVMKIDESGTMVWQRCLGGSGAEYEGGFTLTSGNGCLIVGATTSSDGQVTGFHGGIFDGWAARLDAEGSLLWQRAYGGAGNEHLEGCILFGSDGFLLLGGTDSNDGDVIGEPLSSDYWFMRIDGTGGIIWQRLLGGSGWDYPWDLASTADGGFLISGTTGSNDGDVSGNHGAFDAWVVKLGPETVGVPEQESAAAVALAPNPASDHAIISFRTEDPGPLRIDVFDSHGALVATARPGSIPPGNHRYLIAVNHLSPGPYCVRVEQEQWLWNAKLMIE